MLFLFETTQRSTGMATAAAVVNKSYPSSLSSQILSTITDRAAAPVDQNVRGLGVRRLLRRPEVNVTGR